MQPHDRRLPGAIVNRHYVEPAGTLADVPFRQKPLCRAHHQVLFLLGNAQFRQPRQIFPDRARSHFHECQRFAIITDEIEFALDARGV
jgi:hypothetical protein